MTDNGATASSEVRGLATVGGDVAVVTGARAASFAIGAVMVVLVTRLLGPSGYAQMAYAMVLATLVSTIGAGWTAAAVTRYGREELERTSTLRRTSWARLVLTMPLVALGCAIVCAIAWAGWLPPEIGWTLVGVALASGIFLTTSEHLVVVLEAAGRMRTSAVALLLRAGVVVVAVAALALAGAAVSPAGIVAVTSTVAAILTVVLAAMVWRLSIWPPVLDRPTVRRLLVFSLPMIAFTASQYGMRSIDIVILSAFEPAHVVGVYALAFQGFVYLSQLTTTITIVVTPLFVSLREARREADIALYVERLVPQLALAGGLVVALLAPVAALLLPVIVGDDFSEAVDPLVLLLGALLLSVVSSLAAPVVVLYERSRAIASLSLVAFVVNLVFDLVLVGVVGMGVTGPAVASLLAAVPIAVGYVIVASRCAGVRARFPLSVFIAPAGGLAAALLLPAGIALVVAAAAIVAGVAAGRAGGVLTPADAELLDRLRLPGFLRRLLLGG